MTHRVRQDRPGSEIDASMCRLRWNVNCRATVPGKSGPGGKTGARAALRSHSTTTVCSSGEPSTAGSAFDTKHFQARFSASICAAFVRPLQAK